MNSRGKIVDCGPYGLRVMGVHWKPIRDALKKKPGGRVLANATDSVMRKGIRRVLLADVLCVRTIGSVVYVEKRKVEAANV